jgi:hypothetical protein
MGLVLLEVEEARNNGVKVGLLLVLVIMFYNGDGGRKRLVYRWKVGVIL